MPAKHALVRILFCFASTRSFSAHRFSSLSSSLFASPIYDFGSWVAGSSAAGCNLQIMKDLAERTAHLNIVILSALAHRLHGFAAQPFASLPDCWALLKSKWIIGT